jgi:hypothetical protein
MLVKRGVIFWEDIRRLKEPGKLTGDGNGKKREES